MNNLWQRLKLERVGEAAWEAVFNDLATRYREPQRHYHDWRHIAEVTAMLKGLEARLANPFNVFMAAFFHDAVLVSGAKDNEEKSAALAAAVLTPFVAAGDVKRIRGMILATQGHGEVGSDVDLALFLDADLAILGSSPERFQEYDAGIRAEYGHVPAFFYRRGRRKFLERMLARAHIFHDAAVRSQLEAQARVNIANALAA